MYVYKYIPDRFDDMDSDNCTNNRNSTSHNCQKVETAQMCNNE